MISVHDDNVISSSGGRMVVPTTADMGMNAPGHTTRAARSLSFDLAQRRPTSPRGAPRTPTSDQEDCSVAASLCNSRRSTPARASIWELREQMLQGHPCTDGSARSPQELTPLMLCEPKRLWEDSECIGERDACGALCAHGAAGLNLQKSLSKEPGESPL